MWVALYVIISDPRIWEFKRLSQREVAFIIFRFLQEPALVLPILQIVAFHNNYDVKFKSNKATF